MIKSIELRRVNKPGKSELGITFLELIVVVGIMGIVSLGAASLFLTQLKNQSSVRFRTEVDNLNSEVRDTLNRGSACFNTVGPITLAADRSYSVPSIKDMTGVVTAALNTPLNDRTVSISEVTVSGYRDLTFPSGRAIVTLKYNSVAEVSGPSSVARSMILWTKKNAAGQLTSCLTSIVGGDSKWLDSTVPDAIYYDAGAVGIGTMTPRSRLDVGGVISGMPAISSVGATINFGNGNIQYTSSDCTTFSLNNLKDGTAYTFVVKGPLSSTCAFNAFSGVGVGPLTVHLPAGHGATIANKHTVYSFFVAGSDVYFAWIPGY